MQHDTPRKAVPSPSVVRPWIFGIGLIVAMIMPLLMPAPITASTDEDFGKPRREFATVSRLVHRFLQRHLSNRELNEEMAQRAMRIYLQRLDPTKLYFTREDVDEFREVAPQIVANMDRGDFSVAFLVFQRLLDRVDERVVLANELIDSELDFTADEYLITDRDQMDYASSDEEFRDRWRQRIKYNLLLYENEEAVTDRTPRERLRQRYQSFANRLGNYKNEDVIEIYLSSITASFDPHTSYMARSTFESFLITMGLELEGIGATLQSTDDGLTVIRRIVPDGAADKQGELKVEDKILAVGQEEGEMVDITDMRLDDVVDMIRGKAGTVVRLSVLSPGSAQIRTISIVRERVELKDSAAQSTVFEVGEKPDGSPYQIGVIDLPSFYSDMMGTGSNLRSTTRDVERILRDFENRGVDAVVLDLRRNGGGSLREAIDCTGLFINDGPIVQVKNFIGNVEVLEDNSRRKAWTGPLVVMTSKFSASASEILAGAVQDYERGLIVGDSSTHGKGTVQTLVNLGEEFLRRQDAPPIYGALKLTIQQFYRPSGDSTQKRGVLADIVLPAISDHMDIGEADLDYPVEFDRIKAAPHNNYSLVASNLIAELRQRSEQRVAQSEDFQRQQQMIERYLEQKASKRVTLNREQFNQQRSEFDKDEADRSTIEDQMNPQDGIQRDFYMEEVLQITGDYIAALQDHVARRN